jgi:TonB family protein
MTRATYRISYGSGPSRGLALAISFAVLCGAALMLQQGLLVRIADFHTTQVVPVTPEAPPPKPKVDAPKPPVDLPDQRIVVPMPQVPQVETGPSTAPTGTTTVPPDIPASLRSSNVLPIYPETALTNCEQGTVALRLHIGADGRVITAAIATSSGYPDLDRAALRAAHNWRYRAARLHGKRVESTITQTVRFNLANEVGHRMSKRELEACLKAR